MQLILRKHWKLWVVGNHVDPKASYCNKTFRRRQWLHKLLVYGELVQDGMSQCCQPTLQSNFTRVAYDAQQLRWHEEAGPEKGRRMEEVYCALCKDEAAVCSLVWRWRGEVEIDKVEPGQSLPTKSQSLVFEICKERPTWNHKARRTECPGKVEL